jgi:protein gp37
VSDRTSIEWTEATWNPVTGCSKVSPGCAHCYAEALSLRFGRSRLAWTPANSRENVKLHADRLEQPSKWRGARLVFVNSMSDLFHEEIPIEFLDRTIAAMERATQHTYQVLTKRPERALRLLASGMVRPLPDNVWIGVSIESSRFNWRADVLRQIPARVRFISAEPLLGSLLQEGSSRSRLNLAGIDWVIVGGESGHHARAMKAEWAREVRDACQSAGVPFFFKQWGGRTAKAGGRVLDGTVYDGIPPGVVPTRRTASSFPAGRYRSSDQP